MHQATRLLAPLSSGAGRSLLGFFVLLLLLLLSGLSAMPSYDDVLLVVKSGDANSLDVANYFKNARKIPDLNVLSLPVSGSPMSLASRDALASGISNYLDVNGLADKIRFIVLSYGFPQEAYDTGGVNVGLLDVFLTYRLARNEQAFATNNPYAFVRTENYNNRENIKFSRQKYGYYIVSRLEAPGTALVKKMIDSAGAGHYDSYKSGIKYVFEGRYAPVNTSSVHWPEIKNELLARGVTVIDYDAISSGAIHNIKDVSFAHFDWVYGNTGSFSAIDEITSYPNAWKQMTFQPGSVASCYRSFGAALGTYPYGGLYSYNAGTLSSWSKTDGSDVSLRQQNDVAIDETGNKVWCALGVNPSWVSWGGSTSDVPNVDAEDRRGGGVAVYDKSGNLLQRHTKASTGGGLLSDAVYQVRYDKWNNRIWVGTFRGLCYYDIASGSWGRIAGLSDINNPAMIHDLYVDPTTSGRYIYATFRTANGSLAPTFSANWRWLWEYDTTTGLVKNYNLGLGSQESTSIVKTEATSVWAVCHSSYMRVLKYRLDTLTKIQDICLTNIDGTNYNGNITSSRAFQFRPATDQLTGVNYVYVPITCTNPAAPFGGVLRIADLGATSASNIFGATNWYQGNGAANATAIGFRVVCNPAVPGEVYLVTRPHAFADGNGMGKIIRLSPSVPAGVEIKNGASSIPGHINQLVFDEDTPGKFWIVRNHCGINSQQSMYYFFQDGLTAAIGGISHNSYYYDGLTLSGWSATGLIPTANPDYYLYHPVDMTTTEQLGPLAMRYLDGMYLAEARLGALSFLPSQGSGGHMGHLLTMDPKMAPYAPRPAEVGVVRVLAPGTSSLKVKLVNPAVRPDRDTFLASTINASTVSLRDNTGRSIAASEIRFLSADNSVEFVPASSFETNRTYTLTLKCGVDGIKNSMGASLVNTRGDEWRDEVDVTYQFSATNTDALPVGKNRILSLDPAWASLSSRDLKISCELAPESRSASVFVFTLNGARVKTIDGVSASQSLVHWDGRWENGQIKTGVYLLVLRVDGRDEDVKKIVILRESGGF